MRIIPSWSLFPETFFSADEFSRWWWIIHLLLLQLTGNKLLSWLMKVLIQHQSCRQLWAIKEITISSAVICVCLRSLCCSILCLTVKSPVVSSHLVIKIRAKFRIIPMIFYFRSGCPVMHWWRVPGPASPPLAAAWEGSKTLSQVKLDSISI